MRKTERLRETVTDLSLGWISERAREGWKLQAVEWVREVETDTPAPPEPKVEIPYGLRVRPDCLGLEPDPDEHRVVLTMLALVVEDTGCGEIARVLNDRGFRTRDNELWTAKDIFQLMPRLIEAGQHTLASDEWVEFRRGLRRPPA
jgi:hypothetical protein